jgi:hypothetical protein
MGEGEGVAHVRVAASGGKAGLGRSMSSAPEGTPWMQRHRNDGIDASQNFTSVFPHHRRQRRGQDATSVVLERVDDLAARPVVEADTARESKRSWRAATACAE